MYYSLLLAFSIAVFIPGQHVFSISIWTDDLNSSPLLFDSTSSSSFFNDDDEFSTITTAGTLPNLCAADATPDGLSLTQDGTDIFSRRRRRDSGPECLPPVNIGADTLQLFDKPLDSLENIVVPLNEKDSDDSFGYPGLLPDNGENGNANAGNLDDEEWQDYAGPVHYAPTPESETCRELTALQGNFPLELCCNHWFAGVQAPRTAGTYFGREYDQLDDLTKANQDFAVLYSCVSTFLSNHEVVFPNSLPPRSPPPKNTFRR